jgi:hypothetical protein
MKDTAEYRRQKRSSRFLAMLIALDIGMAIGVVCFWHTVAPYLAEPVGWATSRNIPPQPELFDYPVELAWLIPLLSGSMAWLAVKLTLRSIARFLAAFPLLLLVLVNGWFVLAPLAWR